jgi:iron complex transport system permease protein
VILAALVGAALAISGAVFQGVFRNPLVEPYIMGVSSGAAVRAGIAIMFGFYSYIASMYCVFVGVFAAVLAYSFATIRRETPLVNLILAGIVVNAMFDAGLAILKTIAPYGKLQDLVFWLMGGFGGTKWVDVSSVESRFSSV